jgi:hypothetical protein
MPKYLASQTGAPFRIANALGAYPKASFSEAEQAGENTRVFLNWATGLKLTNYTNSTGARVARSEQAKADREYLRGLNYDESQIDEILKVWRAIRAEQVD